MFDIPPEASLLPQSSDFGLSHQCGGGAQGCDSHDGDTIRTQQKTIPEATVVGISNIGDVIVIIMPTTLKGQVLGTDHIGM